MANYNGDIPIKTTFPVSLSKLTLNNGLAQAAADAFGPVPNNESTEFRTTSKLNTTADEKVYAICKGNVLVVPQSGTGADDTLVNLVLKPYSQPSSRLPIKYFVYRGVKKSSILDATGSPDRLIQDNSNWSGSKMLENLWTKFKAFNNYSSPASQVFEAKWIGYNDIPTDLSKSLDSFFFKTSTDDLEETSDPNLFELPMVEEGEWIASTHTSLGLDIVLDMGDIPANESGFSFDLTYACAPEWKFNTSTIPPGILERGYRESIIQFIDPAAFWGLHHSSEGTVTDIDTATTDHTNTAVYTHVISKFITRNRVYILIDSDRGRSYNYYGNYNDDNNVCLKLSTDGGTNYTDLGFGATASSGHKWPILYFVNDQSQTAGKDTFSLKMLKDSFGHSLSFLMLGAMDSDNKDGFVDDAMLSDDGEVFSTKQDLFVNVHGVTSPTETISTLIRLVYHGKLLSIPTDVSSPSEDDYFIQTRLDDFFLPLPPLSTTTGSENVSIFRDKKIALDKRRMKHPDHDVITAWTFTQIQDFIISAEDGVSIIERMSFESHVLHSFVEGSSRGRRTSSNKRTPVSDGYSFNASRNNFYSPAPPHFISAERVVGTTDEVSGLRLNHAGGQKANKFFLGLSRSEYDTLFNIISSESLKNPRLFFGKGEPIQYTLPNKLNPTLKYLLGVTGETSSGDLKLYFPSQDIAVYSSDDNMYSSFLYFKNLERVDLSDFVEGSTLNIPYNV